MIRALTRCAGLLAVVAVLPLVTGGCEKQENKFVPPPPPPVSVSRPEVRPVTDYLELTGNTQAVDQAQLQARVEGFLTSIHFRDGDYVKKGDLLFTIEQDVYKAKVLQAEGQLAATQAQLERAVQEYTRQVALLKQNATATSEVEKWKAQRDEAEANIVEARANLELARINLGYCRVTAPFDGRMDRHLVTPGNLVGAGKPTELAVITRMDPIYAYFALNERDLVQLMTGAHAKGEGYKSTDVPVFAGTEGQDGYPTEGRFDFVSTSVDAGTGGFITKLNPQGTGLVYSSIYQACSAQFRGCNPDRQIDLGLPPLMNLPAFRYEGIPWTVDLLFGRLALVIVGAVIVLMAAACFHRFDPAKSGQSWFGDLFASLKRAAWSFIAAPSETPDLADNDPVMVAQVSSARLASLPPSAAGLGLFLRPTRKWAPPNHWGSCSIARNCCAFGSYGASDGPITPTRTRTRTISPPE